MIQIEFEIYIQNPNILVTFATHIFQNILKHLSSAFHVVFCYVAQPTFPFKNKGTQPPMMNFHDQTLATVLIVVIRALVSWTSCEAICILYTND